MDRADVHRDKLFIKGEGAEGEADSFPLGDGVGGFRGPFRKDDQGAGQHPDRCMTAEPLYTRKSVRLRAFSSLSSLFWKAFLCGCNPSNSPSANLLPAHPFPDEERLRCCSMRKPSFPGGRKKGCGRTSFRQSAAKGVRPAAFGRRFDNGTGAADICFWQSGHIGPGFELAAHGYAVQEVQPVDMFPQTVHLECVVWMSKEK